MTLIKESNFIPKVNNLAVALILYVDNDVLFSNNLAELQ